MRYRLLKRIEEARLAPYHQLHENVSFYLRLYLD